jgi:hypothetical protein
LPLDITPSLPLTQTIRYATATWYFDRDGGDIGLHTLPSQQVPAGALMLGAGWTSTTPVTSEGTPTIQVKVGSVYLGDALGPLDYPVRSGLDTAAKVAPSNGSFPIMIDIQGAALTDGWLTIYVFYVL